MKNTPENVVRELANELRDDDWIYMRDLGGGRRSHSAKLKASRDAPTYVVLRAEGGGRAGGRGAEEFEITAEVRDEDDRAILSAESWDARATGPEHAADQVYRDVSGFLRREVGAGRVAAAAADRVGEFMDVVEASGFEFGVSSRSGGAEAIFEGERLGVFLSCDAGGSTTARVVAGGSVVREVRGDIDEITDTIDFLRLLEEDLDELVD